MRFARDDITLTVDDRGVTVEDADGGRAVLPVEALRWIVLAAGPAVLVDLHRAESQVRPCR